MRRRFARAPGWVAAGALIAAAGCGGSATAPAIAPTADRAAHQAWWAAHRPPAYRYEYQAAGFLTAYAGRRFRLVVRDTVVQSATDVATGRAVADPAVRWPTVEGLFAAAAQAAGAGTLSAVRYDPTYGYPTEIDVAGPPDAGGSVTAGALAPVP